MKKIAPKHPRIICPYLFKIIDSKKSGWLVSDKSPEISICFNPNPLAQKSGQLEAHNENDKKKIPLVITINLALELINFMCPAQKIPNKKQGYII